jgi:hypothetical protein
MDTYRNIINFIYLIIENICLTSEAGGCIFVPRINEFIKLKKMIEKMTYYISYYMMGRVPPYPDPP